MKGHTVWPKRHSFRVFSVCIRRTLYVMIFTDEDFNSLILDRLFDIAPPMAATPFQADRQKAANTQEILRARQAVENREEEGCVYSIPLSDLIGKLF